MVSKYSEARKCANTNRASIENNRVGNIDMNIVQNKELTFHNVTFNPMVVDQKVWLTSAELAKALKYSSTKSISTLYSRNADEFTPAMTQVIEMMTSGNYRKKVRVFSIRGAHLIAMFATTPVAKEFRRWVLDILDREVDHSPIAKQFTDDEIINLCYVQLWIEKCQRLSKHLYPSMRDLGSDVAGTLRDIACEARYMTDESRKALLREAENLDGNNFIVKRAQPMLAMLRGEKGWIH